MLKTFQHFSFGALATRSNPHNHSRISWTERIPPNAQTMEAYCGPVLKCDEENTTRHAVCVGEDSTIQSSGNSNVFTLFEYVATAGFHRVATEWNCLFLWISRTVLWIRKMSPDSCWVEDGRNLGRFIPLNSHSNLFQWWFLKGSVTQFNVNHLSRHSAVLGLTVASEQMEAGLPWRASSLLSSACRDLM